jgi:DEAD/DEAH box helicase domain-containing protein
MRSGLSGMSYILGHLAPFFLMCDQNDLGTHHDPKSPLGDGQPVMVIYDNIPGGIGLSERLFEIDHQLFSSALDTILSCACQEGCPSCVGPAAINMKGGKRETLAIIDSLLGIPPQENCNQGNIWTH